MLAKLTNTETNLQWFEKASHLNRTEADKIFQLTEVFWLLIMLVYGICRFNTNLSLPI